ncbi:hypothetical protein D3C77_477700 [compost metagenome]
MALGIDQGFGGQVVVAIGGAWWLAGLHVRAAQQTGQAIGKLQVHGMLVVGGVRAGVEQHHAAFRGAGIGHGHLPVCNECTVCEAGALGKFSGI